MRLRRLRHWLRELFQRHFGRGKRTPFRKEPPPLFAEPLASRESPTQLWQAALLPPLVPLYFGDDGQVVYRAPATDDSQAISVVPPGDDDFLDVPAGDDGPSGGSPGWVDFSTDEPASSTVFEAMPGFAEEFARESDLGALGLSTDFAGLLTDSSTPIASAKGGDGGSTAGTAAGSGDASAPPVPAASHGSGELGAPATGGSTAAAANPLNMGTTLNTEPTLGSAQANSAAPLSQSSTVTLTQPAALGHSAGTAAGSTVQLSTAPVTPATQNTLASPVSAPSGNTAALPTASGLSPVANAPGSPGTTPVANASGSPSTTPVADAPSSPPPVADAPGSPGTTPGAPAPAPAGGVVTAQGTYTDPVEGQSFSAVVATFTDSYSFSQVSDFLATIDWGDGQTSVGYVAATGVNAYQVTGTHVYLEEGTYTPNVTVTDVLSGNIAKVDSTIVVDEAPIQLDAFSVRAVAGQFSTAIVGSYGPAEPNDPPAVIIDWGDGSQSAGAVNQTSILGTHAYAKPGSYTVTLSASEDGVGASASAPATVITMPLTGAILPINPVEGELFNNHVATVQIPAGMAPSDVQASDFTALIDWGDGNQSLGTIVPDGLGDGGYFINGMHTFNEEGAYTVAVTATLTINHVSTQATFTGAILVLGAPLTMGTIQPFTPVEAQALPSTTEIATFHDDDPTGQPDDYAAVVDWGDGLISAGTVLAGTNPGDFVVEAGHLYQEEGAYSLKVTIEDEGTSKLIITGNITVADAPLVVYGGSSWTALTGVNWYGMVGTFDEGLFDPSSEFSATINWGDGSITTGHIYGPDDPPDAYLQTSPTWVAGNGSGAFAVFGNHAYAVAGTYTVTLTVHDAGDSENQTSTMLVSQSLPVVPMTPPPNPYLTITATSFTIQEGQNFSGVVATVIDHDPPSPHPISDADDLQAFVDWGDAPLQGNDSQHDIGGADVVDNGNDSFTIYAQHAFVDEGSYTFTVYVLDLDDTTPQGGGYGPASGSAVATVPEAIIENVTLQAESPPLYTVEGQVLPGGVVATFTTGDPGALASDFSAVIDWGDGSPGDYGTVSGGGGSFSVIAPDHTYDGDGGYQLTVVITRNAVAGVVTLPYSVTTVTTVAVADAPVTTPSPAVLTGTAGIDLGTVTLTTFTDVYAGEPVNEYTVVINWGDGTPLETFSYGADGGVIVVQDHHDYENAGQYTARITLSDDGYIRAITSTLFNIGYLLPPPPAPQVPPPLRVEGKRFEVVEGTALNDVLVALFYDSLPHVLFDNLAAVIDWGDGTTTAGELVAVPDPAHPGRPHEWQVFGSWSPETLHTYADAGAYLVTTTITSCGDVLVAGYCTALVNEAALTGSAADVPATGAVNGEQLGFHDVGLSNVVLAHFSDANLLTTLGEFTAVIDWGDSLYGLTLPPVGGPPPAGGAGGGAAAEQMCDTTPGQIVFNDGVYSILGSHVYKMAGSFLVQVFIQDDDGAFLRILVPVTVTPASTGLPVTLDPMTLYDPNPYEWVTNLALNYGDGTPQADEFFWSKGLWQSWPGWAKWWNGRYFGQGYNANGSIITFPMTHAFAETGTANVQADTLSWVDDAKSVTGLAPVADAGLWTIGLRTPLTAVAGQAMDGTVLLATFADDDPNSTGGYSVTIEWGDGTTGSGTVVLEPDGTFGIKASHTYAQSGKYTPIFSIRDAAGARTTLTPEIDVSAIIDPLTAIAFAAVAGEPTDPFVLAKFIQSDGTALQDSATIDWGDGSTSAGTIIVEPNTLPGDYKFEVLGSHTYQSFGTYLVKITVTDLGGHAHIAYTTANVFNWTVQTQQLSNDPLTGQLLAAGEAQYSPNTGELQLSQALDFDLNPGTSVGLNPQLIYNSATVNATGDASDGTQGDAEPVIQLILSSDPHQPVPDKIDVAFAWGDDVLGDPVTFTTASHEPGDDYVLGLPATPPPAKTTGRIEDERTGQFWWHAVVHFYYGGVASAVVAQFGLHGTAIVVDQKNSPIGAGWGIAGVSRLVPVCHGVLWVYGDGDWRYFAQNPDGSYVDPPEDFGTLIENADGSWTYTARDQTVTNFNYDGLQTSVVDMHGLTTSYTYDDDDDDDSDDTDGALIEVDSIDGGVTTLSYNNSGLTSIDEPGGRTWSFIGNGNVTTNGADLGTMTSPAGWMRTLSYDSHHWLIADSWSPLSSSFTWTQGALTGYAQGGSNWKVTPTAVVGLNGAAPYYANAPHVAEAVGKVVSPLDYTDTWTTTATGEPLRHIRPDQRVETWVRNSNELAVLYTDWMNLRTSYSYDNLGDMVAVAYPDGGTITYAYGDPFGLPTKITDQDNNVTLYVYNSTADLTQTTDADGGVTTNVWSASLLVSTTDPAGDTIAYTYDGHRRKTSEKDYNLLGTASIQHFGYDGAGNLDYWQDGAQHVTLYATDGVNNVTQTTDGNLNTSTQTWTPSGLPLAATDYRGIVTKNVYQPGTGLLTSTTTNYGSINPLDPAEMTQYGNDADGMQTDITSPMLEHTHYYIDVDSRQVAVTDPDGYTSDTLYDDDSRVTETADNDRNITLDSYDAMARQLSEDVYNTGGTTMVSSQEWTYDKAGNVTKETDGDHNYTLYTYDGIYDVLTTKEYDSMSQLEHSTTDVDDGDGEVDKETDGDGNYTLYVYNADGSVLSELFYDKNGTLTALTTNQVDGDGEVTWSMDGDGNVTTTGFDGDGNVTSTTEYDGNPTLTATKTIRSMTYGYDADDNLTSTTDGDSNQTLSQYNSENDVTSTVEHDNQGNLVSSTTNLYDKDERVTASTDGDGNETDYLYDGDSNVLTTKLYDPLAQGHNLISSLAEQYDGNGNAVLTTDGAGNKTVETFDADANVLSDKFYDQYYTLIRSLTSQYDGDDNTVSTTDGDTNVTTDSYDDNQLTEEKEVSATGRVVSDVKDTYDKDGNVTQSTDGDNNVTTDTYLGDQVQEEKVTSASHRIVSDLQYLYDLDGNVTQSTDGDGNITTDQYDGDQLKEETKTNALSVVYSTMQYLYDPDGNVSQTADGDQNPLTPTSVYIGDGTETTNTWYGDQLREAKQTDAQGLTVSDLQYLYDPDGNVTETTDGDTNSITGAYAGDGSDTKNSYDGNQLTQAIVTSGSGRTVSDLLYLYDKDGNVTQTTDGDGNVTADSYDGDQLSEEKVTSFHGRTISDLKYLYDLDGNTTQTTDGDQNVTADTYNGDEVMEEKETSASGRVVSDVQSQYDEDGNVMQTTDGDGNVTTDTYDGDELTEEKEVSAGIGSRVVSDVQDAYDHDGNITWTKDGDGNVTTDSYAGDELTRETETSVSGRIVSDVQDIYDQDGNVVATVDGDVLPNGTPVTLTVSGGYASGFLTVTGTDSGDGALTINEYDGDQLIDAKAINKDGTDVSDTQYRYDAAGNVVKTAEGDQNTLSFSLTTADTYVGDGTLTLSSYNGDELTEAKATDATGDVVSDQQYAYDPAGNVIEETTGDTHSITGTYQGDGTDTKYTLDGNETTEAKATSATGKVISDLQYLYDADGNVIASAEGDTNPLISLASVYAGDGTLTVSTFNGDEVTEAIATSGSGRTISDLKYAYDEDGNTTQTTDGDNNVTTDSYNGDQVMEEKVTSSTHRVVSDLQYLYDEDGNVTQTTDGDHNVTTDTIDGDQVTEEKETSISGRTVSDLKSQYDEDGNVTQTTDGDGNITTNTYEGDELTEEKEISNSGRTVSDVQDIYDEDGNIVATVDGDETTSGTPVTLHVTPSYVSGFLTVTGTDSGDGTLTLSQYDGDQLKRETQINKNGAVVSDEQYVYDDDGNVVASVDGDETPAGVPVTLSVTETYGSAGDLDVTGSDNGDGALTVSTYDGDELQTQTETRADGRVVRDEQYLYDENGNVIETSDGDYADPTSPRVGDGDVVTNHYDGDELTQTTDTSTSGRPVSSEQDAYDRDGNVTQTTDGDGNVTTTTYDGDEVKEEKVTSPINGITIDSDLQYLYDADGNVTQTTDGDGNVTTDLYDGDEVTRATEMSTHGHLISDVQSQYDKDGNVTQTTDGDGNITTSHYDGDELTRQSETSSTGRPVSDVQYLYDEDGNTIASADGDTNTLLSTTSPYTGDGTLTVSTYDGDQLQEEKSTDTNVTHPIVSDVHYLYDEDGNVTQTTDGDGTITNDTYDGDEMTEQKVLSGSRVVTDTLYLYDDDGHVIQQTLIVNPAVGGEHDITVSVYNGDELMTNSVGYASAAIATTCYTYDLDGNIASEIDPDSNTTSYTYDGNANVVTMTSPLGTTSYQYDEDGNRTQSIDPANRKIVSSYEGDELTAQTWYNADGSTQNTLAFHYDADGNLLLASNNAGSYSFSYNGDQVTSQTDPNGLTLTYGYDSDGNITSLSDSQGGTETWTYAGHEVSTQKYQDTSNQLSIGFTYDTTGNITNETLYSDAAGTHLVGSSLYSYDGGEITSITHQNSIGTVLAGYSYGYNDQSGRLTSKTENGVNTAYGYDATGQLTSAGSQSYSFDANGNSKAAGAVVGTDNELTSDGTWNYSYGALGTNVGNPLAMTNPNTGITWTYTYDDANELTSATEKNSMGMVLVSASYTYDAFGNRIATAVTQGGTTTTTASSYEAVASPQVGADLTNWRLWADLGSGTGSGGMGGGGPGGAPGTGTGGTGSGGATVVQTRYIAGAQPDQWLARVDASAGVSWLLTDYEGSIRLVANAAMSVIDMINYDAFGAITTETNAVMGGRLKYDGYQWDATTGWVHAGRRDYDAAAHIWVQQDPTGLAAGPNPYEYADNRPTNATDPSGLNPYMLHWHHLLPQAVFTDQVITDLGLSGQLNIHSNKYGYVMHSGVHAELHAAGWNADWQNWVDKQLKAKQAGKTITVTMVERQLGEMSNNKYAKYFDTRRYPNQFSATKAVETNGGKPYNNYDEWRKTHVGTPDQAYEHTKVQVAEQMKAERKAGIFNWTDEQIEQESTGAAKNAREEFNAKQKKRSEAAKKGWQKRRASKQGELFSDSNKVTKFMTILATLFGLHTVKNTVQGLTHYKEYEGDLDNIIAKYNDVASEKSLLQRRVKLLELNAMINDYLDKLGDEPNAGALRKLLGTYYLLGKDITAAQLARIPMADCPADPTPQMEFVRGKSRYKHPGFSLAESGRGAFAESTIRATGVQVSGGIFFNQNYRDSVWDGDFGRFELHMKGKGLPQGQYKIMLRLTGNVNISDPTASATGQFILGRTAAPPTTYLSASGDVGRMRESVNEIYTVTVTVKSAEDTYFVAKFVPGARTPEDAPVKYLGVFGRIEVVKVTGPSGKTLKSKW